MSKGLGWRQRDILDQLRRHGADWVSIGELAGEDDDFLAYPADLESTRRAVHKLAAAGLVEAELRLPPRRPGFREQRRLMVRLAR